MEGAKIEIEKEYRPESFESRWYDHWLKHDLFRAGSRPDAPAYCIVLPPPNITGKLHLGHALNHTLQDILVRWMRMRGRDALWLPGTDHAGIATQMVVERDLRGRGLSRHDIGREKFLDEVWRWKEKHGSEILATLKRLGASCDWSRLRFTMDEGLSRAVREVFVSLYEAGLIYRAEDLINWCPSCRTALSELEVETVDSSRARLWEIAYPLADPAGEPRTLVVATTRPETMLGDTAIAVHPEDERYRHLIGRQAILPLLDRKIPIIADSILVDPAFGTGVVKVTPAHDFNDFETGKRHGLPLVSILDEQGRINANGGPYEGLDRFEARERVLADLEAQGLLIGVREHQLALRRCGRCETVVEPFYSRQWFVKIESLAKPALEAVETGAIAFVPDQWKKTYFEWMRNIHDWCISRQLWWGHRIPAWYCAAGHVTVAHETPDACAACGARPLVQDEDVLDTWFSSALWPFSTMGWPDETVDLKRYYPTSVLSTGPDIIFFWVARMIMMGLRYRGEIPFREVYFHGLVRDGQGQKMSKTRGNVLDPDDLMAEFGADPVRLTLAILASPGSDIPVARERMEGYRAFANKLWNASRFVLLNLEPGAERPCIDPEALLEVDRWILGRVETLAAEVNGDLGAFRFDLAANRIYRFIWHEFCDWYIEWIKPDLLGRGGVASSERRGLQVRAVLLDVLDRSLRLLHPFMPHLTEELWQKIPGHGLSIAIAPFPDGKTLYGEPAAVESIGAVVDLVGAIRNLRAESGIDPARRVRLLVKPRGAAESAIIERHSQAIATLARCQTVERTDDLASAGPAVKAVNERFEAAIPLEGVADVESESRRLHREREKVALDLSSRERKLSDEKFLARAPAQVVEKEKAIHAELTERLQSIDRILAALGG
jgi:valyl-tRNA synthetase